MSTAVASENALVVIGDRVAPTPYLQALVKLLRAENAKLPEDKQIQYVICQDYSTLAVALKKFRKRISLVLVGPGLDGKQDMIVRLIGREIKSVLVMGPRQQLAETAELSKRLLLNLLELGIVVVLSTEASEEFWKPIVKENVMAGIASDKDLLSMSPDERAEHLDRRLESVTMFPALPETQNRVNALDDMDPPKKWAEAIDRDVPIRTVILSLLNSAHYSFRSRITTIEQAVSLASARTIREVVLACTVQRLFQNVAEARIDQFWRHSVAAGFFCRILALPAIAEEQTPQEKAEFARLQLEDTEKEMLRELRLWKKFDIPPEEDAFTAGLLHDIGKVTIALCFEDSMALIDPIVSLGVKEADVERRLWAESPRKVERTLMSDMDHQVVGGRIARRWGLSQAMQEVITQHHLVRRTSGSLTRLVALADMGANMIHGYPFKDEHNAFCRLATALTKAAKTQVGEDGDQFLPIALELYHSMFESQLPTLLEEYEVPENLWKTVPSTDYFRLAFALSERVKSLTGGFLQMTQSVS